jgi:hypothetical protein
MTSPLGVVSGDCSRGPLGGRYGISQALGTPARQGLVVSFHHHAQDGLGAGGTDQYPTSSCQL